MTKTAVKADEWAAYQKEAKGLERDYVGEILKSRALMQKLAFAGFAVAGMAVGAVMLLTPLKKTDTVVVRVDRSSGFVDVVSKLSDQTPTQGEAVDKYFLTQYVRNRESYDYNTVQQTYNTTALLSSPDVQTEFFKIYRGDQARDKVLKNLYRISVDIKSVTLNKELSTGVIRFSTEKAAPGTPERPEHQDWIATVAYTYADVPISESDRRTNPLGFQITSYRVDPETVGAQ